MRTTKAIISVAVTFLSLDLFWLGFAAQSLYDRALGPLRTEQTVVWAAALFYLQYVAVVAFFAVLPCRSSAQAAKRGLGVGWVAYATYGLTNLAVIEGWPKALVLVDLAWGLCVTSSVATLVGRSLVRRQAIGLSLSPTPVDRIAQDVIESETSHREKQSISCQQRHPDGSLPGTVLLACT